MIRLTNHKNEKFPARLKMEKKRFFPSKESKNLNSGPSNKTKLAEKAKRIEAFDRSSSGPYKHDMRISWSQDILRKSLNNHTANELEKRFKCCR